MLRMLSLPRRLLRCATLALQAFKHFLLDLLQMGLTVGILRWGLRGFQPRRLGLFSLSLRPWRQWAVPLLAGLATFPAIDWLYKQLVSMFSLEDYLLSGTVEQIASNSDWAAHTLWFAVLAVCAPVRAAGWLLVMGVSLIPTAALGPRGPTQPALEKIGNRGGRHVSGRPELS
jgi:hypothetical protein